MDIEYPKELHDAHNDLPFLPETKEVNKVIKLIPNLFNKESYRLDIRILVQALQNGLKLIKVHRVIQFDQKPWLKDYIDFNTDLRSKAKNEF